MSFSAEIKKEIAKIQGEGRHCGIAEMAAIINSCGNVRIDEGKINLIIQTDSEFIFEKAVHIISNDFNYKVKADIRNKESYKKNNFYKINVDKPDILQKILWSTGIMDLKSNMIDFKIDGMVLKSVCCKRSYIRCSFLSNGSISNPEKSYHLEFVFPSQKYSREFSSLINYFGLNSKVIERKGNFVVYLKEGEHIVDLLNIMGAHSSLLQLENLRITKEIMNNINRRVNFKSANLNKTITASVKQVEDIEFINNTKGLNHLPPHLEEIARIRLKYPEITLKELGEYLAIPISKSGANHRLRKISEIADEIRNGI